VRVEDVETAAPIHQHLGEPRVADDWIDNQRVLAWVGNAVRVILAAEGDGVLRPVEEGGRSLLRIEDFIPLPLALAIGHVHGRSPEDEDDILHRRKAAGISVTVVLLSLAILRGGAAIVLEHVALLESVVDRSLVVGTQLFQHVVEHTEASRGCSRALLGWVNSEGLVPIVVVALRTCLTARLLAFLAPLVLLLGLLGLTALRGCVVHTLAFLVVKDGPHRLLVGSKAGGDIKQLVGVDRQASPKIAHEVPTGRALEKGMHDLRLGYARELGAALGEEPYEVPK
jgi:hypothetical protein